jgi:hypothetical protein
MKHIYTLTPRGKGEADLIAQENPGEAAIVRETITTIAGVVPGFRQKTLSAAAKIDLIVDEQGKDVPLSDLQDLARDLGWALSSDEIKEALDVLTRLDLVQVH